MMRKKIAIYGALTFLAFVLVAVALAQDTKTPKTCPIAAALSSGNAKACSACAASKGAAMNTSAVHKRPMYLDSPVALLAHAETLGLTDVQKTKLQAILTEARKQALAVLTKAQVASLGTISARPVTMARITNVSEATATTGSCPVAGSCAGCNSCPGVKSQATSVTQTTCPVSGKPINSSISLEYKGKTVYFCCSTCAKKFKADPAAYVANLPQFKH